MFDRVLSIHKHSRLLYYLQFLSLICKRSTCEPQLLTLTHHLRYLTDQRLSSPPEICMFYLQKHIPRPTERTPAISPTPRTQVTYQKIKQNASSNLHQTSTPASDHTCPLRFPVRLDAVPCIHNRNLNSARFAISHYSSFPHWSILLTITVISHLTMHPFKYASC